MDVRLDHQSVTRLAFSKEVAGSLQQEASKIASRVSPPASAGLTVSTKAGMGRQGAFAQVIMRGRAALAIEFGTRTHAPKAPLRNALH